MRQTAVSGAFIYAATQEGGIRRAPVLADNLIDFQNWSPVSSGNWLGIVGLGDRIFAINANRTLQSFNGNSFTTLAQYPSRPLRLTTSGTGFTVNLANTIYTYDNDGAAIKTVPASEEYPGAYNTAFSAEGLLL